MLSLPPQFQKSWDTVKNFNEIECDNLKILLTYAQQNTVTKSDAFDIPQVNRFICNFVFKKVQSFITGMT